MRLTKLVGAMVVGSLALGACDAETPTEDAGTPTEDAGTPPGVDAGPPPDAGTPPDAGPGTDAGPPPPIETRVEDRNTGASGEIAITVPVAGQRSFMVVGESDSVGRLAVLSIEDPSGATLVRWQDWDADHGLTNAFFARRRATAINWPIREEDPALVDGDYTVRMGSYRADGITTRPDVAVEVTTLLSNDHDLATGSVRVAILWAAGLSTDADLVAATEDAVERWREIWAAVGIGLEVRYVDTTLDPALPYPSAMSGDFLLAASELADDGEIAMVIGEIIDDNPSQYGVAGHLPGPLVPSTMSAIVVGWLANAGGDGVFSADDVLVYGEVLAHEVGHYVGLFHPMSDTFDYWDALADTPECTTERACETMLGLNMMFPYSICDMGTCLHATEITDDQRGVMHRYTGTR